MSLIWQDPESRAAKSKPLAECPLFEQAHARNSDGKHSHEAAASVCNIGPTKEGILQVLRLYGPSTDERIALLYRGLRAMGKQLPESSPSGLRSRRAWLVQNGFVVEAGEGVTASGRKCAIWRLA